MTEAELERNTFSSLSTEPVCCELLLVAVLQCKSKPTVNCSTGIILSVKTRSEQQVSKLKQANVKLATRVEQLEHSCLEKVKKKITLLIWV